MLLETNSCKLVLLNLNSIDESNDLQLFELLQYFKCILIISPGDRCEKIKKANPESTIIHPGFAFAFFPQRKLREIMLEQGSQPYETVYVTGNAAELEHSHNLCLSTIYFINTNQIILNRTMMPEHEVANYKDLINRLNGNTYGYYGEICAHGIGGTGVIKTFDIAHKLYPDIKSKTIVTGRYFTSSDARAFIHPLTQSVLHIKKGKQIHSMGRLLAQTYNYIKSDIGEVDYLTVVPSRPGKVNNLINVLNATQSGSLTIPTNIISPDLLEVVKNYTPQKEAGNWTNRYVNVSDVFRVKGKTNGHVLLFDDVITSGATVMECARKLYEAGADKVSILVFGSTQTKVHRPFKEAITCKIEGCMSKYGMRFNSKDFSSFYGCPNFTICRCKGEAYEIVRQKYNKLNIIFEEKEEDNSLF